MLPFGASQGMRLAHSIGNDATLSPTSQLAYLRSFYDIQECAGWELVVVDPQFASQRCSDCGTVSADHRQENRYNCA